MRSPEMLRSATLAASIALIVATLHSAASGATGSASTAGVALTQSRISEILIEAREAAGGARLARFAAVTQAGTFAQGGAPNDFTSVANLRNGYSKTRLVVGPATILEGYDGAQWTQRNGVFSIVSLPSMVADAVTQAYLTSNAYLRPGQRSTIASGSVTTVNGRRAFALDARPANGSPVELDFDASTTRLVRAVAQTAQGNDTQTFAEYRSIAGVPTAMLTIDVDPSGTTTTTRLTSARYSTIVAPDALARPPFGESARSLQAPASIPFVSDVTGATAHIVVPVALDGKNAILDFDSGGANFLLPEEAQRLGLKTSGAIATGGVGSKEQQSAFANASVVDFGGAQLTNQSFIVTPLPYQISHPRNGVRPEGLIGAEYLANFRTTIRYAEGRMELSPFDLPAPAGGVKLPFKSDGEHAYVLASVDGFSGYFLLDTGNSAGLVLNEGFVKDNGLFPAGGLPYRASGGVGGGFSSVASAAKTLVLAGVTFADVPVNLPQVQAGFFATRGIAGNLGAGILSRFTVSFDFKDQTVTFIPNTDAAAPFAHDRSGLSIAQTGADAFEVLAVVPQSPAAQAGIVAGDRITAVAGQNVSSGLGVGDLYPYLIGNAAFPFTFVHAGASKTVTVTPGDFFPEPQ